ncbi:twin-arginine translocation pathway signal protein [Pseudomonas sp. OIL-1]|uniref:twin-arginine translocation pathway signal protein n=1 Tax=Pseudomonas sp. OIL-1 TaxID=2706126 RepID=UPI0013A77D67|nr:twin-arginine translocation pathway signal protein [Pseudomonas sp. OIL-1]QIB50204.1 twin-arginine translocation pathway signal protein [Pseudomonas sp. OIL-1]
MPRPIRLNRRGLLKLGVGASVALSTAGLVATITGSTPDQPHAGMKVLRSVDLPVLALLFPAFIGPHPKLDDVAIQAAIRQLDFTLAHSSAQTQKEALQLLGLLSFAPTRGPLTGIWGAIEQASPAEIDTFLQRWRDSRLDLLRQGYKALGQLLLMSWYALPQSWEAAGYPGPPVI